VERRVHRGSIARTMRPDNVYGHSFWDRGSVVSFVPVAAMIAKSGVPS
jgi:hypothetical protein